jgi:rhodanese-related sulfurtransferase
MKEISVTEFKKIRDEGEDHQLIDVREPKELEIAEIGGELIPMWAIPDNIDKISRDKLVVIYCRSGRRSGEIAEYLENYHGFGNVANLKGGILAWSDEVDSSISKY